MLSKGTVTKATLVRGSKETLSTSVNGDSSYNARTTRRAVELLLTDRRPDGSLGLDQEVEVPIGAGFGASGASATSAVYAAASVMGLNETKQDLALYAHRAEIIEQTGLGTVSVIYDHVGAGAITKAGEPGVAEFLRVTIPEDIVLVTACLGPFDKRDAFSSRPVSDKINSLGREALRVLIADPSLDTLGSEGEAFSKGLGLESPEVKKLVTAAKIAGALYASQNMIGYSVHSVVPKDGSAKVATAFRKFGEGVRIDEFEVGKRKAGLVPSPR